MTYDITKQNYETANDWHSEKSMGYLWSDEIGRFIALLPAGSKVLDVGCGGSGRDIRQFIERGVPVEGLDYSHAAVESAGKLFPEVLFHEADMTKTWLQAESYGGIWSCASVLNLEKADVSKALAEFNRLLKKGGALFVSVKEGDGERMVPDKAGERFFSFYTAEELNGLVEGAGFKVVRTDVLKDTFGVAASGAVLPRWISVYAQKI